MIYLVKGSDEYLRRREVKRVIATAQKADAVLAVQEISAKTYKKGDLSKTMTPSLFGDVPLLVVQDAGECSDDFIDDIVALAEKITKGEKFTSTVVILHSGVIRGKKALTALGKIANPKEYKLIEAAPLKKDTEKQAFAASELRALGKSATNDTLQALVQYAGNDLAELSGYINQISSDMGDSQTVPKQFVDDFFKNLLQVDVWSIISAAVSGNSTQAIALFRHGLQAGASPNALIPAVSRKLRDMSKVASLGRDGRSAQDVGMQSWQVKNIQNEMRGFSSTRLVKSLQALSSADYASKTGSADVGAFEFEVALRVLAGDNLS
ncbi:MAG: DNA polymerase III subunit delta [Candidatus Ancillula sp.]|jgi:DNA polymerase-3 subunit delta|nr:DNA polymerase III subunit delta [Candidatus Ancillula sp.]